MRFRDSLEQNPAPKTLGDVRLRYDTDLLIGETARPSTSTRPALYITAGFAAACVSALFLLLPEGQGGSTAVAIVFGVAAALLVLLSSIGDQKSRGQRRFALNFFTETLRVDRPSKLRGAPSTILVKFDDVTSIGVTGTAAGGAALWVEFKGGRELIIDAIPEEQGEDLVRLHRMLEGAFGLRRPDRPFSDQGTDPEHEAGPEDSFEG